jgi:hypothetical protein
LRGLILVTLLAVCTRGQTFEDVPTADLPLGPTIVDVELFEPLHYSPQDLHGSRGGGTRLRLVGNNLLNPDGSFDNTILVTVGGHQATVLPFLSSSTQLVIDTPAVPDETPQCCHAFKVPITLADMHGFLI